MKMKLLFTGLATLIAPLFAAAPAKNCGCECCRGREVCCCATDAVATKSPDMKQHALRGVVTAVHADRSALMVKHEEIPGVMRAMTMLFRVDDATLKAVKKGDHITGKMSHQDGEWVLREVKVVPAPTK